MKMVTRISILAGLAFGFVLILSDDDTPEPVTKDDTQLSPAEMADKRARTLCKFGIEAVANDPSSIEWVGASGWPVTSQGNDFQVRATLRAKNGFGALILTEMQCQVRHRDDGDWEVIRVTEQ